MEYYQFYNPVKICSGENAIQDNLGKIAKKLNFNKVLIISGPVINKIGLVNFAEQCLMQSGIQTCVKYCNVPNESSINAIEELCNIYTENNCDSVLAIGGGSVLDTAKAVRLAISQNDNDISKFFGYNMSKIGVKVPFVAIPTTCGTGAEVTKVSVIYNESNGAKEELISEIMLPDFAILDPKVLITLPKKSILLTAFDALSHAIEGYCSKSKNHISDVYSKMAITKIFNNLELAISENANMYNYIQLLEAANYAGISFSNSMVGGVHAIAHSLGSVLSVSHDYAVAMLLPYVLKYNLEYSNNEYAELYDLIAQKENNCAMDKKEKAEMFICEINKLFSNNISKIGGNRSFIDCGLNDTAIKKIAELALTDGAILTNARYLSYNDIINILECARNGEL